MHPNPFLGEKRRPIVVGHRGVPTLHQENTLAGFRRAVALGLDAIELDVRLTADRRAVVCHDEDLERLTGARRRLSMTSWDQLSKLRVRDRLPMGIDAAGRPVVIDYERPESIPSLAEVFAEVGDDVVINVELKLDAGPWWHTHIAEVVALEVATAGLEDRVVITSFDLRKLRAIKRAHPRLAVGFCFDDGMLDVLRPVLSKSRAMFLLGGAIRRNVAGRFLDAALVGADHTLISRAVVNAAHARGLAIGTHTLFPIGSSTGKPIAESASSVAEVERLTELGVDWIESDDPARLQELLGRVA